MKKNSGHQFLELLPQLVKLAACWPPSTSWCCIDSQATDDIDIKDTPYHHQRHKAHWRALCLHGHHLVLHHRQCGEGVGFFTRKYYKAVQTLRMQVMA